MSRLLAPALARLFPARTGMNAPNSGHQEARSAAVELGAAVDRFAEEAAARSSREAKLRETMDELLKRLDRRTAQHG